MKLLIKTFLTLALVFGILMPATVMAQSSKQPYHPFNDICAANATKTSAVCDNTGTNTISGRNGAILKAVRIVTIISGMAAVIIIIVAGLTYVTANGDTGKVQNAKNAIIYTFVGLAIILMAQAIIVFIINKFA